MSLLGSEPDPFNEVAVMQFILGLIQHRLYDDALCWMHCLVQDLTATAPVTKDMYRLVCALRALGAMQDGLWAGASMWLNEVLKHTKPLDPEAHEAE